MTDSQPVAWVLGRSRRTAEAVAGVLAAAGLRVLTGGFDSAADPLAAPANLLVLVEPSDEDAAVARRARPAVPVLLLVAGEQPPAWPIVPRAPGLAPASGWLPLDSDDDRLVAACQALLVGLDVQPAGLSTAADASPQQPTPGEGAERTGRSAAAELLEPLTARELQVFELLAKGLGNRDIAAALGITHHTAKFHVAQILEKTGSATRTEAVRQGFRLGLIGL